MKELIDILYEDDDILVLNKPNGILTTAPAGIDNMVIRIREFLCWKNHQNRNPYVGIVHRLDRPASGVIVFGLHPAATRNLCDQFQNRSVEKEYRAFVSGHVPNSEKNWNDTMRKVPDQAKAEIVDASHPEAKQAVANVNIIEKTNEGTLLQVELHTGRTHQIRLQASSRGFPIWGDIEYGSEHSFGPPVEDERRRPIALHAQRLCFNHPTTSSKLEFTAENPSVWQELGISHGSGQ